MALADMPQSNKQHPVPQNIMDVEFKLIGDLTMRQFAYLVVCAFLAYISFVSLVGIFKFPIALMFVMLGIGLAFIPVEERGLDEWIVNFVRAVYAPTQKIWKKEPSIPTAFMYDNLAVVKQELITLAPTSSRRKLEEYLKYQDNTQVRDPLDIPEQEYLMKVREAYANMPAAPSYTPSVGVAVEEPEYIPQPEYIPVETPQLPEEKPQEGEVSHETKSTETPQVPVTEKPGATAPTAAPQVHAPAPAPIVKKPKPHKQPLLPRPTENKPAPQVSMNPITPDMHAGRRFTNLLPSQGELVLPIRGERVLKTSDELNIEQDIEDKADRLKQLLDQIKQKEGINVPSTAPMPKVAEKPAPAPEPEAPVAAEATQAVDQLKQQNDDLLKQIEDLKNNINQAKAASQETSSQEQLLIKLELQQKKAAGDYEALNRQILELQNRLKEKEQSALVSSPAAATPAMPSYAKIMPMTNKPNIISGLIKDHNDKALENILLIVKNSRGEPVRAFKSNSIGQFILSTPLANGLYSIEVSPVNNIKETFDIISIEIKGEVLPPLEMKGKLS